MHPRNIYKDPPDFNKLAEKYEEFSAIANVDLNGKIKIDFKDPKAVRALTRCLLQRDFNLDVILDEERLVPTLPLRLNYILWLEDILNNCNFSDVKGLDIGCGASCIYPLLAAKYKNWKMIGVDVDDKCIEIARENILKNQLQDKVTVIKNTEDNIITNVINHLDSDKISFSMCNPPFFDVNQNVQNRTGKRKRPNSASTGSKTDLSTDGGEVRFITKIIEESCVLRNKISIFTTMLGQKSSLNEIRKVLQSRNITNIVTTIFQQGRTTRWGIAWSHSHCFPLNKNTTQDLESEKKLRSSNLLYKIPNKDDNLNFEMLVNILHRLFSALEIQIELVEKNKSFVLWQLIANNNTWSNQRRKRRQFEKLNVTSSIEQKSITDEKTDSEHIHKKIRNESEPILICGIRIGDDFYIEMNYFSGTLGRDGVNQILQYIKNNYNNEKFIELSK